MNEEKIEALALIAESIRYAANKLGTNGAATDMGALELLAKEVREGGEIISASLSEIAAALNDVACAIRESS